MTDRQEPLVKVGETDGPPAPSPTPVVRSPLSASTPGATDFDPIGATVECLPPDTIPTLYAGQRLDRYRLERRLGGGGFADVWLATHLPDNLKETSYVLKFLRPSLCLDRKYVEALQGEASALAEISHPNVVPFRGIDSATLAGTEGSQWTWYFLRLAYDPSLVTLEEFVRAHLERTDRPLSESQMESIARQAAAGLGAVHARGLLHLDLSPRNILVAEESGLLRVLLCDFGLAMRASDAGARPRAGIGTPGFTAPEVERGEPPTVASDIYSLAAVLAWTATGKPLPDRADDPGVALPAWLRRSIKEALSRDPTARPQGVEEFLSPPRARPHRAWIAGGAVLLLGCAVWFSQFSRSPGGDGDSNKPPVTIRTDPPVTTPGGGGGGSRHPPVTPGIGPAVITTDGGSSAHPKEPNPQRPPTDPRRSYSVEPKAIEHLSNYRTVSDLCDEVMHRAEQRTVWSKDLAAQWYRDEGGRRGVDAMTWIVVQGEAPEGPCLYLYHAHELPDGNALSSYVETKGLARFDHEPDAHYSVRWGYEENKQ